MWREFMLSYSAHCDFSEPATPDEINEVEQRLGLAFSEDLRSFLQEANGASVGVALPGEEDLSYFCLVWSTQEILDENLRLRASISDDPNSSELFSHLLCFTNEPNGDPMAVPVIECQAQDGPVVSLSQHDNYRERRELFISLREHLTALLEWADEQEPKRIGNV